MSSTELNYLGRQVSIQPLRDIEQNDWSDALVLWFDGADSSESHFIASVVRTRPLGVLVAGANAEARFEKLIHALSKSPGLGVMTAWRGDDVEEVVEDFFWGFFPAEDRFDRWRRYVVLGPESALLHLMSTMREVLDSPVV